MATINVDYSPSKNAFVLSFPYDAFAVAWVKGAPERRFLPSKKLWVMPATAPVLDFLRASPHELNWSTSAEGAEARISSAEKAGDEHIAAVEEGRYLGTFYPDYIPKTSPMAHQVEGFVLARDRDAFGIFFEQGLGKTKLAIDLCGYWLTHDVVDAVIVLCPNFVKGVWRIEVGKHAAVRFPLAMLNASDGKKRRARMQEARAHSKCWVVTNYEELLTDYYHDLYWIATHKRVAIVADESTRIKNRAASTTKNAVELARKCVKRLILTGTPMANNPLDFWAQFRFLNVDLGYASFAAFRNYHAVMGGYGGYEVLQWQHLDELKRRVSAYSLRRTKEECLDLPEKIYQVVRIEMPKEMRDAYESMRKKAYVDLAEHSQGSGVLEATAVITKLLRLSQICGGTLKMEDGHAERLKHQPKLDALEDVLDGIDPSHSIIIWARFVEELKMISELLTRRGIAHSLNYGDTPAKERDDNIARFQAKESRVFIGQPHAVGIGITLTAASYAIYYSNDYSYETRIQSEDRCHRVGTTGNVTYIDLAMENSVDEMLMKCLEGKQDLARFVVENGIEILKGGVE